MAENTTGFISQIASHPQGAGNLVASLTANSANVLQTFLRQQLRTADEGLGSWAQGFSQHISTAQTAMVGFQNTTEQAFTGLSQGMTKHIANTALYSQSVSDAMTKALKSTLTAITSEAIVRAIYNTALGFYFLAVQAYDQAAQAFEAAAVFGSVAGVAGAVSQAVPTPSSGSASKGQTAAAASKRATSQPAASASPSAATPGGNLTVMVVGESQAAAWLTQVINTGVEQHDLRLVASQTKRSAPAAR
jgi:hypothetical protein